MRNTSYRVNVTQEGNSLKVDSVERLRKYNQHRSEYESVAKSTFSVSNKDTNSLKFSRSASGSNFPPSGNSSPHNATTPHSKEWGVFF